MNVDRFVNQREETTWTKLDELARRAKDRLERLSPDEVLELGALYRSAAADLAIARQRFPNDPLVSRLDTLVRTSRALVYSGGGRRRTLVTFFARDYWVAIRERPKILAVAAVLLLAPALLGALWAIVDTEHAAGFVPGVYQSVAEKREPGASLGLSADEEAQMSSAIFVNNIRVTFLSFAGGIAWCAGTVIVLLFNGALLGIVGGLATSAGNGSTFFELVVAHGLLELSCIIVAAAAGLRLGWALIDPGHRPRAEVLAEEGRRSVEIVLGTVPWLVCAGLIEGFVTPSGFGLPTVAAVGSGVAALYWGLLVSRGKRAAPAVDHTRASVFART